MFSFDEKEIVHKARGQGSTVRRNKVIFYPYHIKLNSVKYLAEEGPQLFLSSFSFFKKKLLAVLICFFFQTNFKFLIKFLIRIFIGIVLDLQFGENLLFSNIHVTIQNMVPLLLSNYFWIQIKFNNSHPHYILHNYCWFQFNKFYDLFN